MQTPNFYDLPDRRVAYSPGTPVLCLIMGTEFRLNQLLCEPIQGTILGKVGHDTYRVQFSRATQDLELDDLRPATTHVLMRWRHMLERSYRERVKAQPPVTVHVQTHELLTLDNSEA